MLNAKTTSTVSYPLIMAAIFAVATAQFSPGSIPTPPAPPTAGAPSTGGVDCFPYLMNVSDCLTFVEGGSNLTKPERGCCPELSNMVQAQPRCLCQLIGKPGQTGIPVDVSRALKLPAACNVTTPPVSFCAAIGIPGGAPTALSEAPSPGEAEAETTVPSHGGNNESPSKYNFLIGLAALFFTCVH